MRLQLEATPEELDEKGDELVRSLVQQVAPFSPQLAETLEKALPEKKVQLRHPALREIHERTQEEYQRTLRRMMGDIHKVITRAGHNPSHDILSKAQGGPFIGPRGGKWADAQHTIPWEEPDGGGASHNGTFRYGAALRPVSHFNVPKGAKHEPHEAFAHGQAVYERPLTPEEIKSYELTPILNDRATEERVNRVLDEMHEYAAEYRELLAEDPRNAEQTIRQALERQGPAHYDVEAAVKRVAEGLSRPETSPKGASTPADPKVGDQVPVALHDAIVGGGGRQVNYRVVEVADDKVKVAQHEGSDYGPWMPKASLKHFQNDLAGKVDLPPSGNPDIDAVTSGQAQFLGKGDDGMAFRVGDKVVKVSTTVPYQPDNPGHRTPEEAATMLQKQVAIGNELADAGVPGIQRSEFVKHGDKGFQIKPWVTIPPQFSREQLDALQDSIIAMHAKGYALNDEPQAGLDANGQVVMFDVGKTAKNAGDPKDRDSHASSDMERLSYLYRKHNEKFVRRDYSEGQRHWEHYQAQSLKWMRDKKHDFAKYNLNQATDKLRSEAQAALKGPALDAALKKIDEQHTEEMEFWNTVATVKPEVAKKSLTGDADLSKAGGPFIGPRGGKWADPQHTIPWEESTGGAPQAAAQPEPAPQPVAFQPPPPMQVQPPPPVNLEAIRANYEAQNDHAQQRRYFTDRNTGLLNARGVDAQPHDPARPMTARFSMEGFKAFNDKFGHEIPDGALRHMAAALSQHMQDGVKRGGDIEGDVRDQAHADEIAEAMSRAVDPQGRLRVVATAVPRGEDHNKTLEALGAAHRARKDAEVAAGKLGHRLKVPVAFKDHPKPEEGMKPLADAMAAAPMGDHAQLSSHHAGEFKKVGAGKAFKTAHLEDTGLLTEDGFHHSMDINPDHHVASADMRGLQAINDAFGRDAADVILNEFTSLIARNGGGTFNAAHPHGDEILAHHADPAQLQAFFTDLKSATDNVVFFMEKKTGNKLEYVVQKGLNFVHGVGRNLDEADRIDLAKNKAVQGDIPPPATLSEDDAARTLDSLGAQGLRLVNLGTGTPGGLRRGQSIERRGTGSQSTTGGTSAQPEQVTKALSPGDFQKAYAGPFIGPRGGKWADPEHTIHWEDAVPHEDIHEEAHSAVKDEVKPAAMRAVAVGADPASLRYVGAGGEGIIFSDKTGRAYRVLRTNDPSQREVKVRMEQDAVEALKGTPAEKYLAPHYSADPKHGVVVRAMVEGHPGGWGTKGLREAYEVIKAELAKQDFSSPEYKEDSFIVPDDGGPPVMVDLGFMYARGKREAKLVTETVDRGDPAAIDLLDQPFAIRNLYYDGNMSLETALRLTAKIKDLKPEWAANEYKNHLDTLNATAREKGDVAPAPAPKAAEPKAKPKRKPVKAKTEAEKAKAHLLQDGYEGSVIKPDMDLGKAEDAIRSQKVEHCALFDAQGNMLARILGGQSHAPITQALATRVKDNGNVTFTHNHPSGGCFSPEDVMVAVGLNLKEMRAVGVRGTTFVLTRPENGWLAGLDNRVVRAANPQGPRLGTVEAHVWMHTFLMVQAAADKWARHRMDQRLIDAGTKPGDTSHPAFSQEIFDGFCAEEQSKAYAELFKTWGWGFRAEGPGADRGTVTQPGNQSGPDQPAGVSRKEPGEIDWGPVDEKEKQALARHRAKVPTNSVGAKVGHRVMIPGVGSFRTEPPDGDDSFPPAVASFKEVDGWLTYTGKNGSQGVVVGTKAELTKWMADVGAQKPDTPAQAWHPDHGGADRIEAAKRAGQKVADAFGLKHGIEFLTQDGKPAQGEHGKNSRLVNAHLDGKERYLGAFDGVEVPQGAHMAAHEMAHAAFSANPEAGREAMQAVADHEKKHGHLTGYHGMAGHHEGLMEAAALFANAPEEMAKRAPELHAAIQKWFASSKPAATPSKEPGAIDRLPFLDQETWDDGTVVRWHQSPFAQASGKPFVASKEIDAAPVGDVPLASLQSTQTRVTANGVGKYLDKPPSETERGDLPVVFKMPDGSHVIQDGHHRLAAAMLRGDKSAKARVVTPASTAVAKPAGEAFGLTGTPSAPKKIKRTPVKSKPSAEEAPLPGQRGLFDPNKVTARKPSQLSLFGGAEPGAAAPTKPDSNAPLPGQRPLFKSESPRAKLQRTPVRSPKTLEG